MRARLAKPDSWFARPSAPEARSRSAGTKPPLRGGSRRGRAGQPAAAAGRKVRNRGFRRQQPRQLVWISLLLGLIGTGLWTGVSHGLSLDGESPVCRMPVVQTGPSQTGPCQTGPSQSGESQTGECRSADQAPTTGTSGTARESPAPGESATPADTGPGLRPNSVPANDGSTATSTKGASAQTKPGRPIATPAPKASPFTESLETIRFQDPRQIERTEQGRVLTEAQDGGLLLQTRDGRLWTIEPSQLVGREPQSETFRPWTFEELARELRTQLGERFEVVTTRHYVVATSAGKPYAQWCAALFERLLAAFTNYWKQRGLELTEPEFPLVAVVLRNEREFASFATSDVGPHVASAKGYYSIEHNRIVLYDLTAGDRGAAASPAEIARRVAASPFNIATVIHEATHQMAFNSGLHTRLADNPLWVTEGMAMFFETPDLTSKSGWKTVGQVNDLRQRQFLEALAKRRPAGALRRLLESDQRFTDPEQSGDAYAEAWALTYFLAKTRPREYVAYLRRLGEKPRLVWDEPRERVQLFSETFGDNLDQFDSEFVRYVRRLK